jgi:hypothetical protein
MPKPNKLPSVVKNTSCLPLEANIPASLLKASKTFVFLLEFNSFSYHHNGLQYLKL